MTPKGRRLQADTACLTYRDEQERASERVIWPFAVGYHETVRLLVAWCELRQDFRSFRTDRVIGAAFLEDRYPDRPAALRAKWRKLCAEEGRRMMALKAG